MKWIFRRFGALCGGCDIRNGILLNEYLENSNRLLLVDKDCPPAYVKVCIWGNVFVRKALMACQEHVYMDKIHTCMVERYGKLWLSSRKTLSLLNPIADFSDDHQHGPAVATSLEDMVTALICSKPAVGVKEYLSRKRAHQWPPDNTLQQLARLPALLTVTGHKLSADRDIEFRLSWSIGEILLASSLPIWIKQGYWAFKYCLKNAKMRSQKTRTAAENTDEGRSVISSYHLKTILFWELEQPTIWKRECPFHVMTLLLERISINLAPATDGARPRLDHYFLPPCDLLECVPNNEILFTLSCATHIQKDPLAALIGAPLFPGEVYMGDYTPDHVYPDGPGEQEGAKEGEKLLHLLRRLLKYEIKQHGHRCETKMEDKQTLPVDSGITSLGVHRQGFDQEVDHSDTAVEFEGILSRLRQVLSQLDKHCWAKHNFYQRVNAGLPFRRSPRSLVDSLEYIISDQFTNKCRDPL